MTMKPDDYLSEFSDPAFRQKAAALIAAEQRDFDDWVSEQNIAFLIDKAIAEATATFAASIHLAECVAPDWYVVAIPLTHPRAQPLIQALNGRSIGEVEVSTYTYEINFRHVFGPRKKAVSVAQATASLKAFALALSRPGFELHFLREMASDLEAA